MIHAGENMTANTVIHVRVLKHSRLRGTLIEVLAGEKPERKWLRPGDDLYLTRTLTFTSATPRLGSD